MTEPKPSLRPTNPATLVVAGLVAAAVTWFLTSNWYEQFARDVPWVSAVTLAGLALFEAVLANNTKARIARKEGRPPVEPLAVARYVVLAKASSLAGSIFAGVMGGLVLVFIMKNELAHSQHNLPPAIGAFVASLMLVAAALWLEHSCRVPKQPDDKDERNGENGRNDESTRRPSA
ncbi:MAG: DUF3180 domain-containing protein [Hamadaea sp.]|uniref:DUF3180 domain-containing protein n=1 Tax=Hamadaea sp. TaxID=2024425 RepID=UPI001826D880|nr:DUF3180 domain-containing protein [Hamadaea sp.]NUR74154.1 DUF3180 domain-containing protein [Hamadaea sp.]NUT19425.1 DUF3180 domain-containing protein [Hamadaea sp.]